VTDNTNGRSSIMSITTTNTSASNPWGNQRGDETVLTDDVLAKVKEIALDELPGGTLVGIEADEDAYVAHMLNAEGTPMTVYVDASFDFVGVG
jgi:hypothetical protein